DVRTDAEFGAVPRPDPYHPTQARKRDALLEPADEPDPFSDHRHAAVPGVELLFELPAELRDVRRDSDVAILERLDDAVGQERQAKAGTRQVRCLGIRRQLRGGGLAQSRAADAETQAEHEERP